jgi:hypothetical protein
MVIPQDVKTSDAGVIADEPIMADTGKPYLLVPGDGERVRYIIDMAAVISGGIDTIVKKTVSSR